MGISNIVLNLTSKAAFISSINVVQTATIEEKQFLSELKEIILAWLRDILTSPETKRRRLINETIETAQRNGCKSIDIIIDPRDEEYTATVILETGAIGKVKARSKDGDSITIHIDF